MTDYFGVLARQQREIQKLRLRLNELEAAFERMRVAKSGLETQLAAKGHR